MRRLFLLAACAAVSVAAQPVQLTDFGAAGSRGAQTFGFGLGIAKVDGALYFAAPSETSDVRAALWQHDLGTGVTSVAHDFGGGPRSIGEVTALGGRVYFFTTAGSDRTIQAYDPATGTVSLVRQLSTFGGAALTAVGGKLFFADRLPNNVDAPHLYDPATGQAVQLAGHRVRQSATRVIGDVVYYRGSDPDTGRETVWGADASTSTTAELAPNYEVDTLPVLFDGALYASAFQPFTVPDARGGLLRVDLATGAATLDTDFEDDTGDDVNVVTPFAATDDRLLLQFDGVAGDGGRAEIYTYTSAGGPSLLADPGSVVGTNPSEVEVVIEDGLAYLVASVRDPVTSESSGLEPATLDVQTGEIALLADLNPGDNSSFQSGYLAANGTLYFSAMTSASTATVELFAVGAGTPPPPDPVALTVQELVTVTDEVSFVEAVRLLVEERVTVTDQVSLLQAVRLLIQERIGVRDVAGLSVEAPPPPPIRLRVQEQVGVRDALDLVGPGVALATRFVSVTGPFDFGAGAALQLVAADVEGMGDVAVVRVEAASATNARTAVGPLDDRWFVLTDASLTLGAASALRFQLGALDGAPLAAPDLAVVVYHPTGGAPTPLPTTYDAAADALVVAWPGPGEFEIQDGNAVSTGPDRPDVLALHSPFPNPAFGRVAVRYDVPEAEAVRVAVYDALGREVAVLADGPHAIGAFHADLDTRALSPGVYVVRMEAGAFVATRSVVVAR